MSVVTPRTIHWPRPARPERAIRRSPNIFDLGLIYEAESMNTPACTSP